MEERYKEYLLTLLGVMQREREERHLDPVSVSFNALMERLSRDAKNILRTLVKEGVLEWHVNINQIPMFNIKNEVHE